MPRQSVSIGVLFDDHADGLAGILTLDRVPDGPPGCYPDPVAMASTNLAADFLDTISTAWLTSSSLHRNQASVRWRIALQSDEPVEHLPPLRGKSLGAAFGLELRHLLDERMPQLEAGWAITGGLEKDGTLVGVEGYERKVKAAKRQGWRVLYPVADKAKLPEAETSAVPVESIDVASEQASGLVGDLQRYLNALISRLSKLPGYYPRDFAFEKVRQRVRLSNIRLIYDERRSRELDQLYVRRGAELYDTDAGPSEHERATVKDWDELRDELERGVILGDPGFGKTWLLKYEGLRVAREQLEALERGAISLQRVTIPVFLRLDTLAHSLEKKPTLVPALLQSLQFEYQAIDFADRFWGWFAERLESGLHNASVSRNSVLQLLLDGWDELSSDDRRLIESTLIRLPDRNNSQILLTSRLAGYVSSPLPLMHDERQRELEVVGFETEQITSFLSFWFSYDDLKKTNVEQAIWHGGEALFGLARIPLMLSFICALASEDRDIPRLRAELYEDVLGLLLEAPWRESAGRIQDDDVISMKLEVLEEVAWHFATDGHRWRDLLPADELGKLIRGSEAGRDLKGMLIRSVLWELSERDGILVRAGVVEGRARRSVPYLFLHRTLHEYLVARYLVRQPDEVWKTAALEHCWFDVDWIEPIKLLAGVLPHPEPLIELLLQTEFDVFHEQLLLAGKCLSYVDSSQLHGCAVSDTIQRLSGLLFSISSDDRDRAAQALSGIRSAGVLELQRIVEDSRYPGTVRALALDHMGASDSVPPLAEIDWIYEDLALQVAGIHNDLLAPEIYRELTGVLEERGSLRLRLLDILARRLLFLTAQSCNEENQQFNEPYRYRAIAEDPQRAAVVTAHVFALGLLSPDEYTDQMLEFVVSDRSPGPDVRRGLGWEFNYDLPDFSTFDYESVRFSSLSSFMIFDALAVAIDQLQREEEILEDGVFYYFEALEFLGGGSCDETLSNVDSILAASELSDAERYAVMLRIAPRLRQCVTGDSEWLAWRRKLMPVTVTTIEWDS